MAEINVTKDNFNDEVLSSNEPVLVDFWASWCGPCLMMAPVMKEIAEENEGKIKVAKINVDEEPELAAKFGIASIPTIILFKDGNPVSSSIGYRPKEQILELLK